MGFLFPGTFKYFIMDPFVINVDNTRYTVVPSADDDTMFNVMFDSRKYVLVKNFNTGKWECTSERSDGFDSDKICTALETELKKIDSTL